MPHVIDGKDLAFLTTEYINEGVLTLKEFIESKCSLTESGKEELQKLPLFYAKNAVSCPLYDEDSCLEGLEVLVNSAIHLSCLKRAMANVGG